ncbi:MAG: MmcB family DNA repair protein [Rhizobiaceae bacterium]
MPIIRINHDNPLTDGRQSVRAMEIRRGVVRHFQHRGHALVAELPLASGRRADLIAMDRKGSFAIVEIKSSIEDFRVDNKWPEYLVNCDHFYFATLPDVPQDIFPEAHGLIIADNYGAEIIREAENLPMPAATRKALMLRFARAAAGRLERVLRHHDEFGLDLPAGLDSISGD